jgi:hypothetical protein
MYIAQLLHVLAPAEDIEIIVPGLPEGRRGSSSQSRIWLAFFFFLPRQRRETLCLSTCIATESFTLRGSLISRWKCYGMATHSAPPSRISGAPAPNISRNKSRRRTELRNGWRR